jgi:hypothetical protein
MLSQDALIIEYTKIYVNQVRVMHLHIVVMEFHISLYYIESTGGTLDLLSLCYNKVMFLLK